jgi:hypothetical protein
MRLRGSQESVHLTYCTNIHAGESWPEAQASLREHLPLIKARVSPQAPLAVGLRVAASASEALRDEAAMRALEELLGDDYYVFTFNGFPYGAFHGQPVKDGAYRPDWAQAERLSYTNDLARLLARLLPEGQVGSISTVPCTFKPWLTDASTRDQTIDACTRNLIAHAAMLWRLREEAGKTIVLALEPEPFCWLETIAETVSYFHEELYSDTAIARMVELTGLSAADAETALRLHLGVCYDVCHAAVEYEDAAASIGALQRAGIPIAKAQLSSALRIVSLDADSAAAISEFSEPVYLHQTMQRRGTDIVRYVDLAPALAARESAMGSEWRSHFHVPIFLESMEKFGTTQAFLKEVLALQARAPFTSQLEVETYTWDVLPQQYRGLAVSDAIARELNWVVDTLRATEA